MLVSCLEPCKLVYLLGRLFRGVFQEEYSFVFIILNVVSTDFQHLHSLVPTRGYRWGAIDVSGASRNFCPVQHGQDQMKRFR